MQFQLMNVHIIYYHKILGGTKGTVFPLTKFPLTWGNTVSFMSLILKLGPCKTLMTCYKLQHTLI